MKSEALVNGVVVNDQTWFKLFIPIIIWIIFWIAETLSFSMYGGGYFGYRSILFFIGMALLLFGIFTKNGLYYRIGFYIYLGFSIISIIMDIVLIVIIWFFFDIIFKILSISLDAGGEHNDQKDQTDKAKEIAGWVLFGYQCFFTFGLGIGILCEICFLCVLKRRIPYFDAYEQYKNQQLQASSPI